MDLWQRFSAFILLLVFLADIKFGCYKSVVGSLALVWVVGLFSLVISGLITVGQFVLMGDGDDDTPPRYIVYISIFATVAFACFVLLYCKCDTIWYGPIA